MVFVQRYVKENYDNKIQIINSVDLYILSTV